MRSGLRGVLAGGLALIVLQVLVTNPNAGRVASLLRVPGQIAVHFLDPSVPAIPDRRPTEGDDGPERLAPTRYPDPSRPPLVTNSTGGD
ncbi:MAG TPA: hypothetical protein VGX21_13320 [Methylomirabilota bacterium]|nr:hypothetical protein [Methylomirabilota bacterium]